MRHSQATSNNKDNPKPMYSLERHFESACSRHPHLKLLESQWRFDQELISKALQNISSVFPHYSRHDASHSRQIIVNIERMLGEKIKYLTATDTWLLLEAAYNHDIGMVITQKQIEDMNDPAFEDFIKEISQEKHDPLQAFAKSWLDKHAVLPKGAEAHSFFQKYTQLLAEWYRRKHPKNSAKIVRNPHSEIGLDSPRNELLPNRLFRALADICEAHGSDFKGVLDLPFSEAGMATEDCHPRYVACLLRMGDLLDLDDNRFCPVMLHMCGSYLPKTSQAHVDKHHSIQHFRLDSEYIEITSKCPNPAAYEVAFDWFQWLEQEYRQQTQHWKEIVPHKKLGHLPILTQTIVEMEQPYLILEQGKKPDFKVDSSAMLELVRGTGLYPSKFDSIREILQNAVDASLIAAWRDHADEIRELDPTRPELKEILAKYAIEVVFEEYPKNSDYWMLRVTDKGTGISLETLKYMLSVGGSAHNKKKNKIVNDMPMWYRPSGSFGLGLQSTYLISDKFKMTTKSRDTHDALEVMFSKIEDGEAVSVKKIDITESEKIAYGTTLDIWIKIDKIPRKISMPWGGDVVSKYLRQYDFTKSKDLSFYENLNISIKIIEFSMKSPIIINSKETKSHLDELSFFCEETKILLSKLYFIGHDRGILDTFFRGQVFSDFGCSFHCLSAKVDFYGYDAKDFLTYSREKILPSAKEMAQKDLVKAVLNYIDKKYDEINADQKPNAAVFYCLNSPSGSKFHFFNKEMMGFKINFRGGRFKTLGKVVNKILERKVSYIVVISDHQKVDRFGLSDSEILADQSDQISIQLITDQVTDKGWFYQIGVSKCGGYKKYIWSESDIQPVCNNELARFVTGAISYGFAIGNRKLFPCWDSFRKLAVIASIPYASIYPYAGNRGDLMILPCL
ncbi:MAG: ATP-binding protein, partial [Moraxellaceae bacterium]